jgi:repressor LexA
MQNLSPKQSEVLIHVKSHLNRYGESPSLTELMVEMGLSTKRSVAFHLDALEKKGYITRTGRARGIRIVEDSLLNDDFVHVPLLGFANAGTPLVLAEEDYHGELVVDKKLIKNRRKVFGLELKGDSMNKMRLNGIPLDNGNYVIVSKEAHVDNGDVVVAIINNGATVKSFKKEGNTVVLYPNSDNPEHRPIYLDPSNENFIAGKVLTALSNPSF